jgi:putative two-component system response regulator
VRNFLETRHLYRRLEEQNHLLEERVLDRTRSLTEAQLEIVERLAVAGDYRDDETGIHCRRVGELSYRIAIALDLPQETADLIRLAAPLHDIGKLAVPDAILRKPGKLSADEFNRLKSHTLAGANILGNSKSELLQMACSIALSHHERWDGSGYPAGLAGEEIPLAGRVVAVADVFDALMTSRPYKSAWSQRRAISQIKSLCGKQFDPKIVTAFLEIIDGESLPLAA